jgi:hypothetical protein
MRLLPRLEYGRSSRFAIHAFACAPVLAVLAKLFTAWQLTQRNLVCDVPAIA